MCIRDRYEKGQVVLKEKADKLAQVSNQLQQAEKERSAYRNQVITLQKESSELNAQIGRLRTDLTAAVSRKRIADDVLKELEANKTQITTLEQQLSDSKQNEDILKEQMEKLNTQIEHCLLYTSGLC